VAFYVSGHGFGHAVRCAELIRCLWEKEPGLGVVVKTSAPQWIFTLVAGRRVEVEPLECDVGVAQADSLHVDAAETLRRARALLEAWPAIVRREAEACRRAGVELVLGDIPAVAFLVAGELGVPSLALANFAWDWIYEGYVPGKEGFLEVTGAFKEAYGLSTLLLKLPMSPKMEAFPHQRPIPLLVRTTEEPRGELRRRLGIEEAERAVLVSFGGIGLSGLDLQSLSRLEGFRFLLFGEPSEPAPENVTVLARRCANHHEWVKASDIVVTKPGYGIVAEALAASTPLLYTSRGEFAEYPLLVEAIQAHLPNRFCPREEFLRGGWWSLLGELTEEERPQSPAVDCSGARRAADAVLEHIV
jgi:L-arabinokinase